MANLNPTLSDPHFLEWCTRIAGPFLSTTGTTDDEVRRAVLDMGGVSAAWANGFVQVLRNSQDGESRAMVANSWIGRRASQSPRVPGQLLNGNKARA